MSLMLIWFCNFTITIAVIQMAMALFSGDFFSDFSALLFLQVAHLSIYINRILVIYSLLLACNYYQSEKKQLLWFVFYQLRLYVVGAVYVLNEA